MQYCTLEEELLTQLATHTTAVVPRPHHTHLLAVVNKLLPDYHFQFVSTQDDWYRLGGVIRADGTRMTKDLEAWAAEELAIYENDLGEFLERHAQDDLLVTRLLGKTHYFVAPYGTKSMEFLQLEVEELQEVLSHRLIDPNALPTDLSELIDPIAPQTLPLQIVSHPSYRLRCLIDFGWVSKHLTGPDEPLSPLQRFVHEWNNSQAGRHHVFCRHWIIDLHEYLDCYRQLVCIATPISLHLRQLRYFHWDLSARGAEMAKQIITFDRAAGYPFAWYFHLVAGQFPPSEVAFIVKQDLGRGYRYLGESDTAILETWIKEPYKASSHSSKRSSKNQLRREKDTN